VAAGALALAGSSLFGPRASATSSNASKFNVQVNMVSQCTFAESWLNFPNYTTNSATSVPGSTTFQIACPGASPPPNDYSITFQFAQAGGPNPNAFVMTDGTNNLTYQLCADANCVTPYPWNHPGPSISIQSDPQNVVFYGIIPSGQAVPLGAYKQDLIATMNF
jgi:spore coat protein U-like protein